MCQMAYFVPLKTMLMNPEDHFQNLPRELTFISLLATTTIDLMTFEKGRYILVTKINPVYLAI